MAQDGRETSRDGLERGKGIRRFLHHIDGQLGRSICSGFPACCILVYRAWVDGVFRGPRVLALPRVENGFDSIRNGVAAYVAANKMVR